MKKIIVGVLLLVIVGIIAGIFIDKRIKANKLKEQIQQFIGKDQVLMESILKVESSSNSMSYKEFFDLCEKSINERTNSITELQVQYATLDITLKSKLVDFLNSENDFIRSKAKSYRTYILAKSAHDSYKDCMLDYAYTDHNKYQYSYCTELKSNMGSEALELISDLRDFRSNYNLMILKEMGIASFIKKYDFKFLSIFEKYKKSNYQFMDDNLAYANALFNIDMKN